MSLSLSLLRHCCNSKGNSSTMKLDPHVFESLGLAIIKQAPDTMMTERIQTASDAKRFKSFFGTSPIVCAKLWDMLDPEVNFRMALFPNTCCGDLGS